MIVVTPARASRSRHTSPRVAMAPKRKATEGAKETAVRFDTRPTTRDDATRARWTRATPARARISTAHSPSHARSFAQGTTKRARKSAGKGEQGGDQANADKAKAATGANDENDEKENEESDGEMKDGEDLDHRHRDDDAAVEAQRDADRVRMLELLKTFTPSQMERYESYRRSNLSKPMLRKLFRAATGVNLNPNGLIILAGVSKMFVGEMVETARDVMRAKGLNEYEEIKPEHLREAAALIDAKGGLMRHKRHEKRFRLT